MNLIKKLLTMLVLAIAATTAFSQEAFYIWRNDGDFDGFFYDEVRRIGYSQTDTLGVTHDHVVSQVIETADSTYLIPLSAIDSVSFVQPEIKFNPRLKRMEELGMMDYLESDDGMTLTFRPNLPDDLRPVEGDVLVCFDMDRFEGGFGGKVTSVSDVGGKVVVVCDSLRQMSDLYVQFITVEELQADESGQQVRHRVAGMKDYLRRHAPRRNADDDNTSTVDLTNFYSFSRDLHDTYDLGKITASLNLHAEFSFGAKFAYRISATDFYIKTTLEEVIGGSLSAELSGTIAEKNNALLSLPALNFAKFMGTYFPLPPAPPLCQLNMLPMPFLRGSASAKVSISGMSWKKKLIQTLVINGLSIPRPGFTFKDEEPFKWFDSFSAEVSGTVQVGLSFPMQIQSNRYLENIIDCSVGNTLYVGPKFTGTVQLDLTQLKPGNTRSSAYTLWKGSGAQVALLSFDNEIKATMQGFFGSPQEKSVETNHSFLTYEAKVFPKFGKPTYTVDPTDASTFTATVKAENIVCIPQFLDVGLLNDKKEVVSRSYSRYDYESWADAMYFLPKNGRSVTHTFERVPNGKYQIVPIIDIPGVLSDIVAYADDEKDDVFITIDAGTLKVAEDKVMVGNEAQTKVIDVETNCPEVTVSTSAGWLHPTYANAHLTIVIDELPVVYDAEGRELTEPRTAKIVLLGTYGQKPARAEVEVGQLPKRVDDLAIVVTPRVLEFDGGENQVTLQVLTNDPMGFEVDDYFMPDWLHISTDWDKNTITVRCDPNPKNKDRTAEIKVDAKSGWMVRETITVTQHGGVSITPSKLIFEPGGGKQDITVEIVGNARPEISSSVDWIHPVYNTQKKAFEVTCDPNYTNDTRDALLEVKARLNNGTDIKVPVMVQQDAYIKLSPNRLDVEDDGGVYTVYVETKLTNLNIEATTDWIGAALDRETNTILVNVEPNSGEGRSGKLGIHAKNGNETVYVTLDVYQGLSEEGDDDEEEDDDDDEDYDKEGNFKGYKYDGVCIGVRWGGDYYDEMMGRGANSLYFPSYTYHEPGSSYYYQCGVYGHGGRGSISSHGSYGNERWSGHYSVVDGAIYGTFTFDGTRRATDEDGEPIESGWYVSLSLYGAPNRGNCLPSKYAGSRSTTSWCGAGCTLDAEEESGYYRLECRYNGIDMGSSHTEAMCFIRIKNSSSVVPYGHPDWINQVNVKANDIVVPFRPEAVEASYEIK